MPTHSLSISKRSTLIGALIDILMKAGFVSAAISNSSLEELFYLFINKLLTSKATTTVRKAPNQMLSKCWLNNLNHCTKWKKKTTLTDPLIYLAPKILNQVLQNSPLK